MAIFAGGAVWAEPLEVERARQPAHVLLPAGRAFAAEATIVIRALVRALFDGAVRKDAVLVVALSIGGVQVANGHARRIIDVQVVTALALHAQATQPMLAYLQGVNAAASGAGRVGG